MTRFVFEIQYNGKNYYGWQIQPKQISIQEKIEKTLGKLFGNQTIQIVGCGRTDAGVHAYQSYFHVDLEEKYELDVLLFKVNRMLPLDITIKKIIPVTADFHARFHATKRTYRYKIHQEKNSFVEGLSLYYPSILDFKAMNKACEYLIGTKDFTSFSKLHTDVKTNICTIFHAQWYEDTASNSYYFEISADRFLRNMVRAIVGTLIEVGHGNLKPEDLTEIVALKNRSEAKLSVPAHGLYLWEVLYPNLNEN